MAKITIRQFLQMPRSEQYEVTARMTREEIIELKDAWKKYEEEWRADNRVTAQLESARRILKTV